MPVLEKNVNSVLSHKGDERSAHRVLDPGFGLLVGGLLTVWPRQRRQHACSLPFRLRSK